MKRNQKRYDPAFKARVALAALQEKESLAQLGHRHGVHPVLAGQWKKPLPESFLNATRNPDPSITRTSRRACPPTPSTALARWPTTRSGASTRDKYPSRRKSRRG